MDVLIENLLSLNELDAKQREVLLADLDRLFFEFNIVSPKRCKYAVYRLRVKVNGDKRSRNLLQPYGRGVKSRKGFVSIPIGRFNIGDKLEISYKVLPYTNIPKFKILLRQTNPATYLLVDPKDGDSKKRMKSGEKHIKTIKLEVK